MKDFEFLDLEDFLEVADGLNTPFKFYEKEQIVYEEISRTVLNAKVWLRTAYVSFCFESSDAKQLEDVENRLLNHGFNRVRIKETAIPIK